MTNAPFISFAPDDINDIKFLWHNTTKSTEKNLLETLIQGIRDKRIWLEENVWDELRELLEEKEADNLLDWFLKVSNYLDKQKKLDGKRKPTRLTKLFRDNPENRLSAIQYFKSFFNNLRF